MDAAAHLVHHTHDVGLATGGMHAIAVLPVVSTATLLEVRLCRIKGPRAATFGPVYTRFNHLRIHACRREV